MTKRYLLITLFYCFSRSSLFAYPDWPSAHVINTDTIDYVTISDSNWQMLEDPKGAWSIDQISRPPVSDQFHFDSTYINGLGYNTHVYWLRCRLRNNMNRRADIFFHSQYADRIDYFFSVTNGSWKQQTTGYLYPTNDKNIFNYNFYVPLSLDAGQEVTVYVRYYINYYYYISYLRSNNLNLTYGSQEKFINSFSEQNIFATIQEALLFGILIIAVIYNLLFFWTVRERLYLYFSLFLLFFAIHYCYSFLSSTSFFRQHPGLIGYTANLWRPVYLFFEIFFIRHFFKTWQNTRRWNSYLIAITIFQMAIRFIAVFAGRLLQVYWSNLLWQTDMVTYDLVNFSILITFIIYARKKAPYTNLLVLAVLPFTLYLIIIRSITTLYESTGLNSNGIFYEIIKWFSKWNYTFNLISVFWLVIFFTLILFFRYKRLQIDNTEQALEKERMALEKETERSELIATQKIVLEQQVRERTAELHQSLEELKSTQAQLVQSEKMASLGELTAGIAHEIQNPLNFVNNFSEVSRELLDEMKTELSNDNKEEAGAIADDVKQNLEKVIYHGKRADAIVKGMLQHSRSSSGAKEPTNLNALCDEYLRLSYHGLRAKDKTFNADFKTDFDESIGNINIIPQDIGRVLLNLFNNAFYAVNEKQKKEGEGLPTGQAGFKAMVAVKTKKFRDKVEISVSDNGAGIPQKIIDKIFQPFFTTKPTGQGTGLGLSLSYDIVKVHGGELKVATKEGEGTSFIVQLPITTG
jgi:two-component system, NtrC family, sensor kinase